MTDLRNKNIQIIYITISWSLAAVCMIVIFALSHQTSTQSNGVSSGVMSKILELFNLELSQHIVRKAAHALEYFGLSMLLYNAYYQSFKTPQPVLSLLSAVLYACSDEIHQYFISGRACMLRDVFIDFMGALASILFCTLIYKVLIKISKLRKREV